MVGVALALTSSLSWGVSDFIGGLQSRRLPLLRVVLVSQAVGLVALACVTAFVGHPAPALHHLVAAGAGGLAGMVGLLAFYQGLAIGSMSIVAPIAATGVAVPVLVGVLGGDRPSGFQAAGIAAAVVGVVLASREHGPGMRPSASARASIGLALLAALGFGFFFVGLRTSARTDALWAAVAARATSVVALGLAAVARPGACRGARGGVRGWLALCLIGLLDAGANALFAVASRHGLLSVVSVLASLYPLATVALARVVLGERVRRVQELGVVAALTGVLLIAAG